MSAIFNTSFEISLRALIILNTSGIGLSIDKITAFDFIAIYGKDFGVSQDNLHGNNNYRFSEYTSKREIVVRAIKELVLKGYVAPHCDKNGFKYSITSRGKLYCEAFNDEYAEKYTDIIKKANVLFSDYSERNLISCINGYAIARFGGDK